MSNPFIQLKKDKEKPVLRFHPWIFSGAVLKKDHAITPGTIVDVLDYKGNFLALAFYEEGSIAAKIISFHKANINLEFWTNKLENAKILREQLKVYKNPNNNMFRAFHGEGDFLPGLIIDIYDRVAVMQPHAHGIVQHQSQISEAIQAVYPEIESIYFSQVGAQGNSKKENHLILGKENSIIKVKENDISFWVDIVHGQKTGFFIDQRDNRKILSNYVENKTVLNTFSYTGGFSCYALTCNPKHVISIDLAKNAHTLLEKNVSETKQNAKHESIQTDVFDYLNQTNDFFDVIVLDPPAFAKHQNVRHNAIQAYKRLNSLAMKRLNKGGVLFTFSCSQVVTPDLFEGAILSACIDSKTNARVIQRLFQATDHPWSIFHPESLYLKGLVLYKE